MVSAHHHRLLLSPPVAPCLSPTTTHTFICATREEEEDEEVGASIVGFFGNPNAGKPKRCPLLTDCGMELVKDF